MIGRAKTCGLDFDPEAVDRIQGDPLADAHDSFSNLYKFLDLVGWHADGVWRKIGPLGPKPGFEAVGPGFEAIHESVVYRYYQDPRVEPKFWPASFESIIREMPHTKRLGITIRGGCAATQHADKRRTNHLAELRARLLSVD